MLERRIVLAAMASQFGNGGGAVIDTINNCGWLAGEQIIFSSPDEVTDFIKQYAPVLIYQHTQQRDNFVVVKSSFGASIDVYTGNLYFYNTDDYLTEISSINFE